MPHSLAKIQSWVEKRISLLCAALVVVCLVLIPFRILGYGYLSHDDPLRHVAKAVSGKSWQEIVVLNPAITIDHHAGWHATLSLAHRAFGLGTEGLFVLAFVSLFCLFALSPLAFVKRPEMWAATMLLTYLAEMGGAMRWFSCRPMIISMTTLIVVLFLWRNGDDKRSLPRNVAITFAAMTFSVWMHGTYYLLLIPIAGFVLARRWMEVKWLTGCWIAASIAGAFLTGHPIDFLTEHIEHLFLSLGQHAPQKVLVSEFRSNPGTFAIPVLVFSVILLGIHAGRWSKSMIDNPAFHVTAICWVLGLKVARFWYDWGIPAMMVWIVLVLDGLWATHIRATSGVRLATALFACAALYLGTTADIDQRWSWTQEHRFIDPDDPSIAEWLPGHQGIVYSADLAHFYETFFTFPEGDWKYSTAFEPGIMSEENRKIYWDIARHDDDFRHFAPWVRKLRPQDRLFMSGPEGARPPIPVLQWKYAADDLWIGRLPPAAPADTTE